jgi:putative transposase
MTLYKGQYRVESLRIPGYDYSSAGTYFITICTENCARFFGEVKDGQMRYTDFGEIAKEEWDNIGKLRQNLLLDEWVVMPYHVHGIIIFTENKKNSLANIIKGYKSAVTSRIWKKGFKEFHWQSRYYEHVIRGPKSLNNIKTYIKNNVIKWEIDEYNPNARRRKKKSLF